MSKTTYQSLVLNFPSLFSNDKASIKIITDDNEITQWQSERQKQLVGHDMPPEWANIGVILDDPYILVIRDLVDFPDGHRGSYFRVLNQADLKGGQGAVVLAEMNRKYLLLNIFRHPTRSWSYEVPRGFGEPSTPAEEQAANEVREETGGEIVELVDLGIYNSNTGLEGNKVKLFFAKLKSIGKPSESEAIESLFWVSLEEFEKMIATAIITDGFTIAAYTRAKLQGLLE